MNSKFGSFILIASAEMLISAQLKETKLDIKYDIIELGLQSLNTINHCAMRLVTGSTRLTYHS